MSSTAAKSEPLRPGEAARLELIRLAGDPHVSLVEFCRRACEIAAAVVDVERVGIWLYVEGRGAIRCASLFERSRPAHSEGMMLRVADFPLYFAALERRGTVPAHCAADDPNTAELQVSYLKPLGIISLLDAGIFQNGQLAGVVCHEHIGPPREWTGEQRDFAGAMADIVALKLKSAALAETKAALRSQERALSELDKVEALARLSSAAAHDFRNLLTVITAAGQMVVDTPGLPADAVTLARQIVEAAGKGTRLVQDMLTFGRQEPGKPQVLDPAATLRAMLPMMRTAIGARHRLEVIENGGSRILIDPSLFERAVFNLVLNARDAKPTGGVITLELGETVRSDGRRGTYVTLGVIDDGPGIDPAVRSRIFEPFYSTKPSGAGLGLAIVHRIAEQAGGFVQIESPAGRGACFRLYFPRVAQDHA